MALAGNSAISIYYRIWGDTGNNLGITSLEDAFSWLSINPSILADLEEVLAWSQDNTKVSGHIPVLPFACPFELHAQYGSTDILAGLGQATLQTAGQIGVGVFHFPTIKAYVRLPYKQRAVALGVTVKHGSAV